MERMDPTDGGSRHATLRQVCVEGHEGLVVTPADSSMKLLQIEKAKGGWLVGNPRHGCYGLRGFFFS